MFRRARTLPGPRNFPLIGNPFAVTGDPLAGLARLQRLHGDMTEFWVGSRHVITMSHPDLAEEVLVKQRQATIKDEITRELSTVLGQGLVTSEGEHWKRQRKAIAPSFQPRHLASYADAMVHSAEECMPGVGDLDVHRDMSRTTLHIVIRTVFGAEPSGEAGRVGELVESLMESFFREQRTAWRFAPKWVPARHRREVLRVRSELDTLIYSLIERARARADDESLLGRLLAARHDEGGGMSDQDLRDELVTLFLAGHETTSLWLGYTLWLLAEHPELQERAHAEVDAVLGGRRATLADLKRLPFCDAVLKESARLYPPVWAIAREIVAPMEVRGVALPLGGQIVISMWTMHRDSRFWVGPERFRPDRWLNGETVDLPRMAYLPFGGGARVCVGNHFASMEGMCVLATVLQERSVTPSPGYAPEMIAAVTLRPRNGVRVRLAARPPRP